MHEKAEQKIAPLTGLRFFAAAAIVLVHCAGTGLFFPKNAFGTFNLGGAVPMFFVLSGFILTVNGMRGRTWFDFMVARFARIWPAHVASILLLFAVFWPWSLAYFDTARSIISLALNIGLVHDLFPVHDIYGGYNAVSWSLSAEMVYYASFPLLLIAVSRRPVTTIATVLFGVLAAMVALPIAFPTIDKGWLHSMNFVSGCWSFTLGIGAGTAFLRLRESPSGIRPFRASIAQISAIACAIAANGWLGGQTIQGLPGIAGFVVFHAAAPAYALLIFSLAYYDGIVSRALSTRPLVYLGEVSFCLYLVHQIVIRWYGDHTSLFTNWSPFTNLCLVLAGSLATAMAFYHLIEVPSRRAIVTWWRKRRSASTLNSQDGFRLGA